MAWLSSFIRHRTVAPPLAAEDATWATGISRRVSPSSWTPIALRTAATIRPSRTSQFTLEAQQAMRRIIEAASGARGQVHCRNLPMAARTRSSWNSVMEHASCGSGSRTVRMAKASRSLRTEQSAYQTACRAGGTSVGPPRPVACTKATQYWASRSSERSH